MTTLRRVRHECAVCHRHRTLLIHMTDTVTGVSAWLCWRHVHRVADVLERQNHE